MHTTNAQIVFGKLFSNVKAIPKSALFLRLKTSLLETAYCLPCQLHIVICSSRSYSLTGFNTNHVYVMKITSNIITLELCVRLTYSHRVNPSDSHIGCTEEDNSHRIHPQSCLHIHTHIDQLCYSWHRQTQDRYKYNLPSPPTHWQHSVAESKQYKLNGICPWRLYYSLL